jgi:hypothetical protein
VLPSLAKLRRDIELPKRTKSTTDRLKTEPNLFKPNTAKLLPTVAKDLKESVLPKCTKSRTDTDEP